MTIGYWFMKLNLNYLKDSSFNASLSDAQKWRYLQLYMLAKELRADGAFVRNGEQLSLEDIAWDLHIEPAQLKLDLDAIKNAGFMSENGHGPYLVRYKDEQEKPKTDQERKEEQRDRERQESMSRSGHALVTHRDTESESESESEVVIESEDESKDSQSVRTDRPVQTSTWISKTDLLNFVDIPAKFKKILESDPTITQDDLLAELAKNFARKISGEVRKPGWITGQNLVNHDPISPEWYDQAAWIRYLPQGIKDKLGLCSSDATQELETPSYSGYTNNLDAQPKWWQIAVGQLSLSRANLTKYIEPLSVHADDQTAVITCPDTAVLEWLEGHAKASIEQALKGCLMSDVRLELAKDPAA